MPTDLADGAVDMLSVQLLLDGPPQAAWVLDEAEQAAFALSNLPTDGGDRDEDEATARHLRQLADELDALSDQASVLTEEAQDAAAHYLARAALEFSFAATLVRARSRPSE